MDTESSDLVRLTLLEGGAAPQLIEALIPTRPLEPGEQYRFHFDMTKCIGCRSCEIACNEQNGNPAEIQWRRVGELEGGVYPDTQRTYLSMGCNHCLSADCLRGCPVDAYTKDPATGIVMHSADACIGCQYCVWNCPYSVPQFNPERGVVGKCDMCRGRLLEGQEPACVNACPENAIQIEIVNKAEWSDNFSRAESPGMPPAGQTISTTRITLPNDTSSWLQRVDTGSLSLEEAHPSLVVMTALMQAAFGTLGALWLAHALTPLSLCLLFLLTSIALNVSVLHLGRPAYAWRALKMWRRSWLSREVLCFGLFFLFVAACTAASCAAAMGFNQLRSWVEPLTCAALVLGFAGTIASACIYLVKARPAWNTLHTPLDFLLSAGLLGATAASAVNDAGIALAPVLTHAAWFLPTHPVIVHPAFVCAFAVAWIINQMIKAWRLRSSSNFESRASFNLVRSERLWPKGALAILCAIMTPLFMQAQLSWLAFTVAMTAVLMGRYLFFVSVVPLSMALTFLKPVHQREVTA